MTKKRGKHKPGRYSAPNPGIHRVRTKPNASTFAYIDRQDRKKRAQPSLPKLSFLERSDHDGAG